MHAGKTLYKCNVCEKAFTWATSCRRHRLTHLPYAVRPKNRSKKRSKTIVNPKKRSKTIVNPPRHQCSICSNVYSSKVTLEHHKKIHTRDSSLLMVGKDSPFRCDICGNIYSTAGNLKMHKMIHTKQKPFVCPLCEKAFTQKGNWKAHLQARHAKDIHFSCEVCGVGYKVFELLKMHVSNIHLEGQPYSWSPDQHNFTQADLRILRK